MAGDRLVVARPDTARGSRSARSNTQLWQSAGDAVLAASRLRGLPTPGPIVPAASTTLATGAITSKRASEKADRRVTVVPPRTVGDASAAESRLVASTGVACCHAAKMGDAATLHMLIAKGPKGAHDWKDENSVAPLHLAASYGHMSCVEIICNAGASLDHANCWGSTALINAAHNAHAGVVKLLILNGASVAIRDKDGTALDNALLRLSKAVRGVAAATDKDHPDKPVLESAKTAMAALARDARRGPAFQKALTGAIGTLKPMLAAAIAAAADGTDGDEAPSAPADVGGGKGEGKKGADEGQDAPEPGRLAAYKGCMNYIRCMEMLRDPAAMRKAETLATGRNLFGGGGESKAAAEPDGLTQRVGRIRSALALDVSLSLPDAMRAANGVMGLENEGSLPLQAQRLVVALGLQ